MQPTQDREWADMLVKAGYLLDADGNLADGHSELEAKMMLTLMLDYKFPGWRDNPTSKEKIVERVKTVGVVPAMAKMITEGLS